MKIIISLLLGLLLFGCVQPEDIGLSLIHISEPTRRS